MNFGFVGGSMGSAVGEGVTRAAELALERKTPLLVVCTSGGARMQEGCLSLMQMAKTSAAFARLHEEGTLVVCLLTDPTYGGVSASFATLGDVLLAEPSSYIGFAGPKVIEQTIRQSCRRASRRRNFSSTTGCSTWSSRARTSRACSASCSSSTRSSGGELPETEGADPVTDPEALPKRAAWDTVQLARNIERPNTLEYVGYVFDDFQELYGDRLFDEDAAIVGGVGAARRPRVVVIGHQKGHTTSEMMERNFGMPNPEGYRKGMRLMEHAARFGHADRHLRRHAGRVSGPRRRGARPVDGDRGVDHEDVAPARPGGHARHRRGRLGRRARARRSATGC